MSHKDISELTFWHETTGRAVRAVFDWKTYEIPEDLGEIPGIDVWDAPPTDAI